jgi:hypothetical protein
VVSTKKFIGCDAYLLGILHTNKWGSPCELINAKLKKNDSVAMKSSRGIMVLKWDDKRDVTLLSTCHSNEAVPVTRCSETVIKPQALTDHDSSNLQLISQIRCLVIQQVFAG